ncbi:Uma2 family endonuclease [Desertibacillus haloalkaliphilus]|nr:Uma2 family endonuclease [Desertibacillus haloalkaliphilus]
MRPDFSKTYSYADYLRWSEGERVELIDGFPYFMTPAPSRLHQQILLELGTQFHTQLKGHPCEAYVAPFDVRLAEDEDASDDDVFTVVQPDIVVVCDQNKLDKRGCNGVPDLVIEIISPSTASHDYIRKMELYETFGVKEYWIVQPTDQVVMVFKHNQQSFDKPTFYDKESTIEPGVISGVEIQLADVFIDDSKID